MAVSDSPAIRNVVHNSSSKVVVTDSGRSESVELHLVSANNVAHTNIQSGMGSESASQAVASKENGIITVLIEKALEFVKEVSSEEISIFHVEVVGGNGIVDRVKIVGGCTGLEGFFGELSDALSSTEGNDDSSGAFIDKEGIGNRFLAPEGVDILMDKSVASEVVASITALHVIEISGLTVGSSGSTEKFAGEVFVVSMDGNKGDNGEEKESGEFGESHCGEINN